MKKIHQLEDQRAAKFDASESSVPKAASDGLAASFTPQEVKNLFFSYLTTILLVEGLIFFFSFINHLATDGSLFPWKPYLFATFITPVVITFVFGLILLTFNRFFFEHDSASIQGGKEYFHPGWRSGERTLLFLHMIHRLPLMLSMFLLIAATALAYKLDAIMLYIADVGATTARYLFFTLIAFLIVAALGAAVWVILSYRMKSRTLSADHQYRMQLLEQLGMVMLDDGTMIDKHGQVTYQSSSHDVTQLSEYHDTSPLIEESEKEG